MSSTPSDSPSPPPPAPHAGPSPGEPAVKFTRAGALWSALIAGFLTLILLLIFFKAFRVLPGPEGRLSPGVAPPPHITGLYTVDALFSGKFATLGNSLEHLILPTLALAIAPFAYLVRLLRANLLDVSQEPFITVARSKGVDRWTAFTRHALPNAIVPTLTAGGIIFAQLIAGSVLVEGIFNWPGIGNLVVQSILVQDYAVVQDFLLLSAVAYVLINLAVDIICGVIDPRLRRPSVIV